MSFALLPPPPLNAFYVSLTSSEMVKISRGGKERRKTCQNHTGVLAMVQGLRIL